MRILLINPPRSPANSILDHAPEEAKQFIHKKLIGPPLGLLTIAAAAKGHDVSVLDMKGEYDLDPEAPAPASMVNLYLKLHEPDIVGVTFIASEFDFGIDIFKAAKKHNPRIVTVAGGLHATLCPHDFTHPSVDLVCPGQSASVFSELLIALEKGAGLRTVPGIFFKGDSGLAYTGRPAGTREPAGSDFIMPDRSYLRRWIPTYHVGKSAEPSTYIYTSLGCPYRCTFCSIWPQFDGKYHKREVESVIAELKTLDDYGVVRFADANTIVDVPYIERLFDRINEEGIQKFFIMDIRFDTAVQNPALIEKLARGGLRVVISGFESFRDDELKDYNKNSSAAHIRDAIRIFHDNGIMVRGNYVIPPDYSEEDFSALADYAGSHRVVYAGYTILTPMPGTDFYREVKGRIVDDDLKKYNFFNCVFKPALPIEKFYENVGRLWLIKEGTDVI